MFWNVLDKIRRIVSHGPRPAELLDYLRLGNREKFAEHCWVQTWFNANYIAKISTVDRLLTLQKFPLL